ncbi:hypothetical protein Tco_1129435, partial [Tanacetum coccineum]
MDSDTHSTYSPWLKPFFPTQGIDHHILLARVVFDLTLIVTEQLDQPPLAHIQLFLVEDVLETLVSEEEHEVHLKTILDLLKKEKLYAKFSKCEFWLKEVQFLGHVVNLKGRASDPAGYPHVDLARLAVTTGFIENFSKIYKAHHPVDQRTRHFVWGEEQEESFRIYSKEKLCNAPVLALPDGPDDFVVYCDASKLDFEARMKLPWASPSPSEWREVGGVRKLIMDEAHTSRYSIHPSAVLDVPTICLSVCMVALKPSGLLQQQEIPEWKWEKITMDLVTKLPRSTRWRFRVTLMASSSEGVSYADKRRKPLEFEVGDRVLLKVSPWKGVVRFGKKGKLAPRYVGPFEIIERVGPVAYRLKLPQELSYVHNAFHVSNLKKCLAEPDVQVPFDEIKIDENLRFVKEPIEIVERDVKKLKLFWQDTLPTRGTIKQLQAPGVHELSANNHVFGAWNIVLSPSDYLNLVVQILEALQIGIRAVVDIDEDGFYFGGVTRIQKEAHTYPINVDTACALERIAGTMETAAIKNAV